MCEVTNVLVLTAKKCSSVTERSVCVTLYLKNHYIIIPFITSLSVPIEMYGL